MSSLDVYSQPYDLLSYAAPTITLLASPSCWSVAPTVLTNCSRKGPDRRLLVAGNNFGPEVPAVFVGTEPCVPVVPDPVTPNQRLSCMLPAGTLADRPVTVVQRGGQLSFATGNHSALLSFAQCEPGFHDSSSGDCLPCQRGSFSSAVAQSACTACAPGSVAADTGRSTCADCPEGHYQPAGGRSSCLPCLAGTATSSTKQLVCQFCAPGQYTVSNGSVACTPCDRGRFQPSSGASACLPCSPGTIADRLGATVCDVCAAGRFVNASGQQQCQDCPAGRSSGISGGSRCGRCLPPEFQTLPGQSACQRCDPAFYRTLTNQTASRCLPCPANAHCFGAAAVANDDYFLALQSDGSIQSFVCLPGFCESSTACDNAAINATGLVNCCSSNRVASSPLCSQCTPPLTAWFGDCVGKLAAGSWLTILFRMQLAGHSVRIDPMGPRRALVVALRWHVGRRAGDFARSRRSVRRALDRR